MGNSHYFLHLTDTHLCFHSNVPNTCCSESCLREIYQTAFEYDHRPEFVLITGDLVHEGSVADYSKAKELLNELDKQYQTKTYPALGNHDIRKNFNIAFRGENSEKPIDYCVQTDWLRLIVLDSSCEEVVGRLTDNQLTWLEQKLRQNTDFPTILVLHHPVYGTSTAETDANNLIANDKLMRVLRDYPVDGILCGHSHEATIVTECGLPPQFVGAGVASSSMPLMNGRVQFWKQCWIQYSRVQEKRLYWSPLCLGHSKLLANMTPQEMLEYTRE